MTVSPGTIFVFEGSISAGKSSLCASLKHHAKDIWDKPCTLMIETIEQKTLSLYLSNISRYACMFQVIQANKRIQLMNEAVQRAKQGEIVLIDRGLPGDYAFAEMQRESGLMSIDEFEVYETEIRAAFPHFLPDALCTRSEKLPNRPTGPLAVPVRVIYLKCAPDIAFRRLHTRNNIEEVNSYTLSYFKKLNKAYDAVVETLAAATQPNLTVETVDWCEDKQLDSNGLLSLSACKEVVKK